MDTRTTSASAPTTPVVPEVVGPNEASAPTLVDELDRLRDEQGDPAKLTDAQIRKLHKAADTDLENLVRAVRSYALTAYRIGRALAARKSTTKRGQYTPWITETLGIPDRTARRYRFIHDGLETLVARNGQYWPLTILDLPVDKLEGFIRKALKPTKEKQGKQGKEKADKEKREKGKQHEGERKKGKRDAESEAAGEGDRDATEDPQDTSEEGTDCSTAEATSEDEESTEEDHGEDEGNRKPDEEEADPDARGTASAVDGLGAFEAIDSILSDDHTIELMGVPLIDVRTHRDRVNSVVKRVLALRDEFQREMRKAVHRAREEAKNEV